MDEDNSARTPRVSPSDEHSMEAELRALLERATREPWDDLGHAIVSPRGDAELGNWMVAERVRWEEDRRLIVVMRNRLPALLSALAGNRSENERLRDLLGRALPSVESDAQMMDAMDRHSPLPEAEMPAVGAAADKLHFLRDEIVAALQTQERTNGR